MGGVVEKRGEEEAKSMPHVPVIFSGYFISDKNRSVLFRDQLYVFWDCLYSGSVFDTVDCACVELEVVGNLVLL